ncbi:uncharacterized protein [Lolium perenne]|uniref:uncharacterized protein n=1 Tax=Lolium perenne TaxID=4522 RepID=UPI0021F5EAA1|nr:uncharacterized protein LOC127310854 [Lolium perenne]
MQLNLNGTGREGSSRNIEEHKGWLALWAAEVPGKAKIHVWRLIQNGLAVGDELQRRNIKEGVRCIACNQEETLLHRFWKCPHSVAIWESASQLTGLPFVKPDAMVRTYHDLHGRVLDWLGKLDDKELSISVMIMYQAWLARNDARDEVCIATPSVIVRRSLALLEEWREAQQSRIQLETRAVEHWQPPAEGWTKANTDGAFLAREGVGASGLILRDHHGRFVEGSCRFFTAIPDPERVELLACKEALILAKEKDV